MASKTQTLSLDRSEVHGGGHVTQDVQTVRADGRPTFEPIDGVRFRPALTQTDERGSVCEMFSADWGFSDEPLVYVYQASLLPGYVKGWVLHLEQDDRLFFAVGRLRVVLFDGRKESPSYQRLNRLQVGDLNRGLLHIPAGVYHAVQNLGSVKAFFYNMPTRPYRHEDPDKYRLPLDTDLIPYQFNNAKGW